MYQKTQSELNKNLFYIQFKTQFLPPAQTLTRLGNLDWKRGHFKPFGWGRQKG